MTTTSGLHRWRENLRQLPGRTPLRVKMITALLALVIIALAIISVASLTVFRSYLQGQAGTQVTTLYNQTLDRMNGSGPFSGHITGTYAPPDVVEVLNTQGQVLTPSIGAGQSVPNVPTDQAWLQAHSGEVTTVPGLPGGDNWLVITKQMANAQVYGPAGPVGDPQTVILVVGVNLGTVNQTLGWLARLDLLVGLIIVLALAVVGIAIVRASLRPLTDIEKTAQAIAAGDLSRRVPDQDPVTEVGRLGRSLNTMLAQIESSFYAQAQSEAAARRSEERMRQFVADASHELRTPLTAMRGYAEYYRQRGGWHEDAPSSGQPSDELGSNAQLNRADMDRIMQRVEQESARMGVLVEDMLLLARLDQQRPIEHRPVDLLTLAADAVQDARIIAPDRDITLDVGSGAAFLILGDEVRLRQVIGNLMNNALTHTPEGTPVAVRLLAGPRQPVPSVVLEVADRGPGLRQDQAEHVFERFYRADQARTRTAGGTGLGLAIVAALVAAHDGTVSLKTAPGQGATFRITLPLAPEAQDDELDESDQTGQASPAEAATTPGDWPGPGA